MSQQRNAFFALVGRPNVGKSSIMNRILGQKVAIVSDKPQTTRTRIMGVLTRDELQLVFVDTPGLHKPRTALGKTMNKAVGNGMADVDTCLLVADCTAPISPAERQLADSFRRRKLKAVLLLNKIDLLPAKQELLTRISDYAQLYDFAAVVPISARTGDGFDILHRELEGLAVPGPHLFDEDTLTDQPERVIAAELLREQLLRRLEREVPHGIAVSIERFVEREEGDMLDIEAMIYCEKKSHKGIIIGHQGAMLKAVATSARQEMERFFDCRINLQCWVKVREDWRNRTGSLRSFGLE